MRHNGGGIKSLGIAGYFPVRFIELDAWQKI